MSSNQLLVNTTVRFLYSLMHRLCIVVFSTDTCMQERASPLKVPNCDSSAPDVVVVCVLLLKIPFKCIKAWINTKWRGYVTLIHPKLYTLLL